MGGAGYIGGWLTDRLMGEGYEVRVFDLLLYEEAYLKEVDFILGDIRDKDSLLPHLKWADAVIWLAALVGDGACSLSPELTRGVNVDSLRWLTQVYDGRIVFMSTCSVYGAQKGILTEQSPLEPLSLYAETKAEAERLLRSADSLIFRLGTIFGVGDTYSRIRLDLVLNLLTVKAILHGRLNVFGGNQYRPLLHVRDVAEAVCPTVFSDHRGIFNLHAENITIKDLAERVKASYPEVEVEYTDMRFQDLRNYCVSSDKARTLFGFYPRYSIEDGIRQIGDLVKQGRIRDTTLPRYSNLDYLRPRLDPEDSPLGTELVVAPPFRSRASLREHAP